MTNYVKYIRQFVGHEKIFLNYATAAIFNDKNELLLQRRGDTNTWGLPGGVLELGESYEDAVLREVQEEIGIEGKIKKMIGVYSSSKYTFSYPNGDSVQPINALFLCEINNPIQSFVTEETLALQYFAKDVLPPQLFGLQNIDMIHDAFLQQVAS